MNILHTDWLIGKKAPTFSQLPRRFFIHIYLLNLKTTMLCLQNSTWAIEINYFKWFTLGLAKKTILGLSCPKNTVTRIQCFKWCDLNQNICGQSYKCSKIVMTGNVYTYKDHSMYLHSLSSGCGMIGRMFAPVTSGQSYQRSSINFQSGMTQKS